MVRFVRVSKQYPGQSRPSLRDITLNVERGEFVFIVGPSGAGKSTLTRLIYREELPTSGQVIVGGVNVTRLRPSQVPYLRRNIGVIFQDFKLLPERTVYENVAFALQVTEASYREIQRRVPAALELVGLLDKAHQRAQELSGGEQQRVAVARAIVRSPSLVLADEPTGNLDPDNSWQIMKLLLEINRMGTTVIVATHAREIVDALQRRVVALEDGVLVRDDQKGSYGYAI
ncbi:cell division ATP-binding protein FtsE [Caldinitratiruptor microaerophilus]|uniref:Cell division ATP-binding protein FtsE n=1 Tax=Caldinitratiruptor microaerophilus TaxID=671077 RepID=A0AA35G930_9FIRM|nr:cell division ATP-binding protein FtsE [Caldinitratiruptor microaerophilus]BDG61700.1 cell division ATP-binding protein FtsE [Caldinitratiruptor microaerophilus]